MKVGTWADVHKNDKTVDVHNPEIFLKILVLLREKIKIPHNAHETRECSAKINERDIHQENCVSWEISGSSKKEMSAPWMLGIPFIDDEHKNDIQEHGWDIDEWDHDNVDDIFTTVHFTND